MHADSRVQEIWLRLLGRADASQRASVEKIEEGYFAVVRGATEPASSPDGCGSPDFSALDSFIPNLARTRAVCLNPERAYGLAKTESLRDWAGPLAEPVERGVCHAFAVVDPEVLARRVSARLQASGWKVEQLQHDLRVSDGRFSENANLLRAIVQMVLSRGNFAAAGVALQAELRERFAVDAGLFMRFRERFARYRPAVFDHYFTAYPECSCMAAGWDYWEVSGCDAHQATAIFERAMEEFESLLGMPSEDWLPTLAADCCSPSITEN